MEIDQSTSPDLKVAPEEHIQEIQTKYKNYNMQVVALLCQE